jgi:hypothetical protein
MELANWQHLHEQWATSKLVLDEYQDSVDQEVELVLMGKSRGPTPSMKIGLVQQRRLVMSLREELDHFLDGCFDMDVMN